MPALPYMCNGVNMNMQGIGIAGVVGGALLTQYNHKLGLGIAMVGVFAFAVSSGEEKKEVQQEKVVTNEETSVRFVGNNAYLIDSQGRVVGVNKLDEPKSKGLLK